MTIKEIEIRSGMTRANIRFYESEGLLLPRRNENGYRDYSEEDFQNLMKIKLLRTLHVSLEEIKAMHNKESELENVLEQHVTRLEVQKKQIQQAKNVCVTMKNDHVKYESLNAEYYLTSMEEIKIERPFYDIDADVEPNIQEPWRRFFARSLDMYLYTTIIRVFLSVLGFNILNMGNGGSFFIEIFSVILMIAIEPLLISKFGTTIGKAVLGICIVGLDDKKLSYEKAFNRTIKVFWKGMGCQLPFYEFYRLWKSFQTLVNENKNLDWEENSYVVLRDKKLWRPLAYIGIGLMSLGIVILSIEVNEIPDNRGEITVAEFAENYNKAAVYYDFDLELELDSEGKWIDKNPYDVSFSWTVGAPDFVYEEKDGVMTGMSFAVDIKDTEYMISSFQNEMLLTTIAFMKAQESCGLFSKEIDEVLNEIAESPFQNFEIEAYGIRLNCEVEYEGYVYAEGMEMLIDDDNENEFHFTFAMEKLE